MSGPVPALAAAGACLLGAGAASAEVVERIVAVVGDDILLLSELDNRLALFSSELPPEAEGRDAALARMRSEVLDLLIDERLIAQEAGKLQVSIGDGEIDRAIDDVKRQNGIDDERLREALAAQGMSMSAYRDDLRRQLLRLKVLNIQVRSRVSITDDEVRRHYDRNVRRAGAGVQVRARHVLVRIPDTAPRAVRRERERKALAIAERARAGADLAELARAESEDEATRADGGDLGWIGRGTLAPELEEALFAMRKGEVRGPIYTDRGAHVVQLVERKASAARRYQEIKEDLRGQLLQAEIERRTRAWLADLRRRTYVDARR